jgi:hypothetical protein
VRCPPGTVTSSDASQHDYPQPLIAPQQRRRGESATIGRMKKVDINSDWFPYAVAAAAATTIAVVLRLFGVWLGV